jgi:hypothetical protein
MPNVRRDLACLPKARTGIVQREQHLIKVPEDHNALDIAAEIQSMLIVCYAQKIFGTNGEKQLLLVTYSEAGFALRMKPLS